MNKREKVLLSIVAVLILVLVLIFLLISAKPKTTQMPTEEPLVSQQTEENSDIQVQEPELIDTATQEPEPELVNDNIQTPQFPAQIEGMVVGMSGGSWIIEQESGAVEVGVDIETPVYKGKVSEETKATVFDVKAGTNVSAKLDLGTGDVLEAVIVE